MAVLYIAGSGKGAGKTALATGLAHRMAQAGRSVALIKPLRLVASPDEASTPDPDISFYNQVLPNNPQPQGWPLAVTVEQLAEDASLPQRVGELVAAAAPGAETIIVEGLDGLGADDPTAQASASVVRALDARVVAVAQYSSSLQATDFAQVTQLFNSALLGLILNGIWRHRTQATNSNLVPALHAQGVPVLGVVPEDRRMLAPSVRDLADHLEGEILLFPEKDDELVEYIMTGGWFLDQGAYVLSRREQKAVVVRGDRPDLQMAALETSTACLVLTEGQNPIQYVTYHAEEEEVPLLLVQTPTLQTMEALHTVADRVTVHNPRKAARFAELLAEHCNLEALQG